MNKTIVLVLALIILTPTSTITVKPASSAEAKENSWTAKAPMPEASSGVKAAVVNGKIYVMAGTFNYEYDPATDNWTAKEAMPTQRSGFAMATCRDKICVIGGNNGSSGYVNYLSTNEIYDPLTDTWETKKPMPTSREGVDANVVNDKIYVIGGMTDNYRSIHTSVNEVYDPATDLWTTKQPAPIATDIYASTVVDNKIYIMGGRVDIGSLNANSNQIYDTETDSWSIGAPLPAASYYATAGATTGVMAPKRIYVIGGGFENTSNAVHVYDPASDNWTSGTPMPTNRSSLAVGVVNDIIYAMGGNLGWEGGDWPFSGYPLGTTNAVEQYTPIGYGTIPSEPQPEPELFPVGSVVAVSVATVAVVGVGLMVYFKKRKR